MSDVRPSATVVLLRDGAEGVETLLLRRQASLDFAAGKWVFPGGAIDADDFVDDNDDALLAAARNAAAREAMEEAGIRVDPRELIYFAHWTTPEMAGYTRRYATWFFAAMVAGDVDVQVDGGEIELHEWVRPQQAIEAHRRGEVDLMAPTAITLFDLIERGSAAEALQVWSERSVQRILPRRACEEGGLVLLYPGDAGYDRCDAALAGPRHRCYRRVDGWHYVRVDC
jgi:8-oxo-dGTP pyrophosphatase MutT (NUDIX family)